MRYLSVQEASEKWGISGRRIRVLLKDGRIDGAVKTNWTWAIPEDSPRPSDGRRLRRIKSTDIRLGFSDIERIIKLREEHPLESLRGDREAFLGIASSDIYEALRLDGREIPPEDIREVLSGNIVGSLSLSDHLVISNYSHLLNSFFAPQDKLTKKSLMDLYDRLFQGTGDMVSFESGREPRYSRRGDAISNVERETESMINQYETAWRHLEGIASAVILFGEIVRISPLSGYNHLYASLVLSLEMMRNGSLFPYLKESGEELRGALIFSTKRGNYMDLMRIVEESLYRSYEAYGLS